MTIFHVIKYDAEAIVRAFQTTSATYSDFLPPDILHELESSLTYENLGTPVSEILRQVLLEYDGDDL